MRQLQNCGVSMCSDCMIGDLSADKNIRQRGDTKIKPRAAVRLDDQT